MSWITQCLIYLWRKFPKLRKSQVLKWHIISFIFYNLLHPLLSNKHIWVCSGSRLSVIIYEFSLQATFKHHTFEFSYILNVSCQYTFSIGSAKFIAFWEWIDLLVFNWDYILMQGCYYNIYVLYSRYRCIFLMMPGYEYM